jgi:Domain of unknown function (DUF4326)
MNKTKVVHCKKAPYDIYIGRTYGKLKDTGWGNPFVVGVDGDRARVIYMYKEFILGQPELLSRLHELKGKTLACWCSPLACHGDLLAILADLDPDKVDYWANFYQKMPGYSDHEYFMEIGELDESYRRV